jgi:uncharacterized protein (TIGR02996 family)
MPNGFEPFYAAVLADPLADAPRLVFADWLDEHGNPRRAEFIRTQVALARLPFGDPGREPLNRRAEELRAAHGDDWLAELPEEWRRRFLFERGFPGVVRWLWPPEFAKRGGELFRLVPVTGLDLKNSDDGDDIGDEGAAALAACPLTARLSYLNLYGSNIGNAGAAALAGSPYLGNLTELLFDIGHNTNWMPGVGDAGATAIAASPHLARLRHLDLTGHHVRDAGALALAESPHLTRLELLNLSSNCVGEVGRAALERRFGDRVRF